MLRKILCACFLVAFTLSLAGCPAEPAKKPGEKAPAADKAKADNNGKRPVSPPHAPGNS